MPTLPLPAPPTGNVTFLFTDIEGSTRLWETRREEMQAALAGHDALLREIMERHGGYVFKTVGDAFCVTFSSAPEAIGAALDIQRELTPARTSGLPLRVRAALHTGTAQERNGDYFGPNVNRVARLMIGAGGQTLLSQTTEALVRDTLPEGAGLRDMGLHHLKDLLRPEQVFQLLHAALHADFPPLKSLDALPHNLPEQLTSFVGREAQLSQVKERLGNVRLLTLTGSGGGGKTRLALQAAADLLEHFPDGVWLVELAALSDPALVAQTVASVLGVREQPGRTVTESLTEYLKPRTLLLLLDTCEHLVDGCAPLVDTLLRACPSLRILATSRAPLGVAGENIEAVPPLSLPDVGRLPPGGPEFAAALMRGEATSLFLDRALAVSPSFAVTLANSAALLDICRRLDGIPLAIELAAARVKVLSAEQIAARLDDRFRLLADKNRRTDLPRQQTLRAMIDWSFDLLAPPEQTLLRRLSVFAGGWTLEAAEAICAGGEIDEYDVLDLLSQLVDKSLVLPTETHGAARYRLLESVREYTREKLAEVPAEAAQTADQHGEWFTEWAESAAALSTGEAQAQWLARTESEHDNLRSALAWSLRQADPEVSLRLTGSLWRFWTVRGYLQEGRHWLALALALSAPETPTAARAKALSSAGSLAWSQGDYDSARALLEDSLTARRALADTQGIADALNNLGNVAADIGEYAAAQELLEESLASMRTLGDSEGIAATVSNLARVAFWSGDFETARTLFEESLAADQKRGDEWGRANSLCGLALLSIRTGEFETAREQLTESVTLRQTLSDTEGQIECLEAFSALAAAQNHWTAAVTLLAAAAAGRQALETPLPPAGLIPQAKRLAAAQAALAPSDYAAAEAHGQSLPVTAAVAWVLTASFSDLPPQK